MSSRYPYNGVDPAYFPAPPVHTTRMQPAYEQPYAYEQPQAYPPQYAPTQFAYDPRGAEAVYSQPYAMPASSYPQPLRATIPRPSESKTQFAAALVLTAAAAMMAVIVFARSPSRPAPVTSAPTTHAAILPAPPAPTTVAAPSTATSAVTPSDLPAAAAKAATAKPARSHHVAKHHRAAPKATGDDDDLAKLKAASEKKPDAEPTAKPVETDPPADRDP